MYLPEKNRIILGTSTSWIILLIEKALIIKEYISIILLTNIMITSILFWYNYKINSFNHYLDKTLTKIYGIYLFYKDIDIIKINGILLFYLLSNYLSFKRRYNLQLLSHLLFRYIFFIWGYLNLNTNNNNELEIISIGYFTYNYYLFRIVKNNYFYYLFETLLLIILIKFLIIILYNFHFLIIINDIIVIKYKYNNSIVYYK